MLETTHFLDINDITATIISSLISGLLLKKIMKKDENSKVASTTPILNEIAKIDESNKQSISEYNMRIIEVVKLLNINKRNSKLNGASIAEDLSIENISLVEDIFKGTTIPSLSILLSFAEKYEVDANWLKTGYYTPFYKHCLFNVNAIQIYKEYKPKTVYIFYSDTKECYTAIAYQKTHYDFRIIHLESNWRLSSYKIGDNGRKQLVSLYKTIFVLNRLHTYIYGKVVSKNEFNDLITGKCSINILSDRLNDYRWEALLDLNIDPLIIERRRGYFGDEFIEAQNIIKSKISKDSLMQSYL